MRFEVPQFIEIEDKVIGPFTWRQFIYLIGGVGIAGVLFLFTNTFVFVIFGLPIAILGGLLGFYPINNRPFSFFLEGVVNYSLEHIRRGHLYLWKRESQGVYNNGNSKGITTVTDQTIIDSDRLSSLTKKLELESLKKDD